jgi:hypothetical protein
VDKTSDRGNDTATSDPWDGRPAEPMRPLASRSIVAGPSTVAPAFWVRLERELMFQEREPRASVDQVHGKKGFIAHSRRTSRSYSSFMDVEIQHRWKISFQVWKKGYQS